MNKKEFKHMALYFLRIKGINLSGLLGDTQDLSTIRGGSLALLDAVMEVAKHITDAKNLFVVSVGASVGIYRFEADNDEKAAGTCRQARDYLLRDVFAHLTFALSWEPAISNYNLTGASLSARQGRAQMAGANLVYPAPEILLPEDARNPVCSIDLVRPTIGEKRCFIIAGRDNPPISRSVRDRRGYGLESKQALYQQLLLNEHDSNPTWDRIERDIPGEAKFAFQLSSISEGGKRPNLRHSLHDKLCVLFSDGSGFGQLKEDYIATGPACQAVARHRAYDKQIRGWRQKLLATLLDLLLDHHACGQPSPEETLNRQQRNSHRPHVPPWTEDNVIRFETLLWGGDEQLFVLPARLGWRAIETFAEQTATWTLDGKQLHHGIGVAFCHHDAPIARVRDLTDRLAGESKKVTRAATLALPVVLESFDHIGGVPELFFRRRTPKNMTGMKTPAALFTLDMAQWKSLRTVAEYLARPPVPEDQPVISRRRLRHVAIALHNGIGPGVVKPLNDLAGEILPNGEFGGHYAKFATHGAPAERFWMLLDEFWDYLVPEPSNTGTAQ